MSDYCVVVADGAHARFFTLEPAELPEVESGPKLIERGQLLNPEKEKADGDLFSDSKPGRGRGPRGGPSHGYDDHRVQHENEMDRLFARDVVTKARRVAQTHQASSVVLLAPARMLGLFRQNLATLYKHGIRVQKLAKDLTRFSPRQIHDFLSKEKILPPCKKPGVC